MTPCAALIPALKAALAGAVIQLSGVCPYQVVQNIDLPGVTILANQASFPNRLDFYNTSGWTLIGVHSVNASSAGVLIRASHDFHVLATECDAPKLGCIQMDSDHDFTVDQSFSDRAGCDVIDVGASYNFEITRTTGIRNVYDHAATSCHPDLVQFSSATGAPVYSGEVSLTVGVGDTQGIDTFDHTALGAHGLNLHDNVLVLTAQQPISQLNVSGSTATNNIMAPYLPGAAMPGAIKPMALFRDGTGNTIDGVAP